MPKTKTTSHVLACFSPPVMIATFAIEITLAGYHLWRYNLNQVGKLIVALLTFLSIFQLAEYFVCGGIGVSGSMWSKIGYSAITVLPPLGFHLTSVIAKKQNKLLIIIPYIAALGFIVFFFTDKDALSASQCTSNYAIFHLGRTSQVFYNFFYFGMLMGTLALSRKWREGLKPSSAIRRQLEWLRNGYLAFIVPVIIILVINPDTRAGIPSIMCGFAILFALVMSFKVSPLALKKRI